MFIFQLSGQQFLSGNDIDSRSKLLTQDSRSKLLTQDSGSKLLTQDSGSKSLIQDSGLKPLIQYSGSKPLTEDNELNHTSNNAECKRSKHSLMKRKMLEIPRFPY
ncbi:hypothetical protein WA158_002999 [Blastocystis sp. Blastoise]